MKEVLAKFRAKVAASGSAHKAIHFTHGGFHLTYLGLVFVEGHSMYAMAAGGLFIVVVLGMILKIELD